MSVVGQTEKVEQQQLSEGRGPWRWSVLWGQPGRRLRREVVLAWDPDEALVEAALLHPEWERPQVAFLASDRYRPYGNRSDAKDEPAS